MNKASFTFSYVNPFSNITLSHTNGFSYTFLLRPSNLSLSNTFFNYINLANVSLSSSGLPTTHLLSSNIFFINFLVISNNFYISLTFFNLTSFFGFFPSKNFKNTSFLVLIFIFYLGVLSPCLNTATTDLSSHSLLNFLPSYGLCGIY
jgi:hypothetical protein